MCVDWSVKRYGEEERDARSVQIENWGVGVKAVRWV